VTVSRLGFAVGNPRAPPGKIDPTEAAAAVDRQVAITPRSALGRSQVVRQRIFRFRHSQVRILAPQPIKSLFLHLFVDFAQNAREHAAYRARGCISVSQIRGRMPQFGRLSLWAKFGISF
jgi:hypothetical protein